MIDRLTITDRAIAAYAVLSGIALAFPHRPSYWPIVAAGHLALLALALWMARVRQRTHSPPPRVYDGTAAAPVGDGGRGERRLRILCDWYPLIVIPLLYSELDLLLFSVRGGEFFDAVILSWDQALFGLQPSVSFSASAPYLVLSEALHAAYLSYYPIIYLPPLVLYLRGDREAFASLLRPLITGFLLHYLVFVYFPVQGPRYLFPAPGGEVAEGPLYQLTHRILEAGSSRGSAFPSSHMAVATIQTITAFRFLPRAAPLMLVATLGIGLGATYGGFHYAIDMIVGGITGLTIGLAFRALDRRNAARP